MSASPTQSTSKTSNSGASAQGHRAAATLSELENSQEFISRHIGPRPEDQQAMLKALGVPSLEMLIEQTVPRAIRSRKALDLPAAKGEGETLARAWEIASKNQVYRSFIGQGYHGTVTPPVVLRNIMENPAWYTAYTPYQAEISQGRLEAILNFQTMVMDLTAMPIANASLLDEGTAAAEAMTMAHNVSDLVKADGSGARVFLVSDTCHPQTIEVVTRRAEPLGLEVRVLPIEKFEFSTETFAALIQDPDTQGRVRDLKSLADKAHAAKNLVICATDLLALTLLTPPGEWGADIVIGNTQRFGVPMGFGGPHAAFLATRDEYKRSIPGRLIGVSIDSAGQPALRLALQTREQHIRREKATSNICTAQVLLAVMASMYAVYHGPQGLRRIAERAHRLAGALREGLRAQSQIKVVHENFFDTLWIDCGTRDHAQRYLQAARAERINLRDSGQNALGISFDEVSTRQDVLSLLKVFGVTPAGLDVAALDEKSRGPAATDSWTKWPKELRRTSSYLQHKVFNSYHSETEMLRYMMRLQQKDLSLAHAMIPLGSCTMKLNATAEMIPVTWPEMGQIHPFAPVDQAQGYLQFIRELEGWLCEITGFGGVSLQPNAGSAGEYAGLLCIRDYHRSRGHAHRNVCLIPSSAHGTNPASAVMAGMKVVVVACDREGNVDLTDLRAKADQHKDNLAALMVTYPSTHGVFEEEIQEICKVIHDRGGQVYMDGANFTAMVGLCRPGEFGPDVMHMNLHKTFCIPHGGGGPGVGPIGVREHLKAFLPGHNLADSSTGLRRDNSAVASAPFGSASILPISWAYIHMMGRDGLKQATEVAILNANYMAQRLEPHFPILYKGKNGRVAHECILDLRGFKTVSVEDVAKRLIDYGFHAPTMSWPVVGTLMVEPTESESKEELDRFCDAMIAIRKEIDKVESGAWPKEDNPLKNAPHTLRSVTASDWTHAYTREEAAYPLPIVRERKFWPAVGRVNNAHGDKNLVCSCAPLESYAQN